MKLRTRFAILMCMIFIAFMGTVWVYSRHLVEQINEQWGTRMAEKQVLFDKQRTLQPLLREIALARQLAAEPALLEMVLHEDDADKRQRALAVMEQYRLRFQDRSYFAAMVKSGHYYFNDAANQYAGKQLRYTLSRRDADDAWFYATVASDEDYQVNVDPDAHLGNVKVWINVAVRQGDKVVAVVGTGIDIGDFIRDTVDVIQAGIRNLFINRDMAVQLHPDTSLIDYASLTKSIAERRKVDVLLNNPDDLARLRIVMQGLETSPNRVETLWVDYAGKKVLLGVAYLPEVGWFDLTLMDGGSIRLLQQFNFIPMFALLFLSGLIAAGLMLHRLVLKPLSRMGQSIEQVEQGDFVTEVPLVGAGEITQLSAQFKKMAEAVRDTRQELEDRVAQRTQQLSLELTERKHAEDELRRSETLLRTLYDTTSDAVMLLTEQGFINCNRAAVGLFGVPSHEAFYALHPADLSPLTQPDGTDSRSMMDRRIDAAMLQGSLHFEWQFRRADNGHEFSADVLFNSMMLDGRTVLQAVVRDISARKRAEEQIRQLAFYDTLTELPNRRMLSNRLSKVMALSARSGCHGALLFLDLDNFKPINDQYGHVAGDALLVEAAHRIKACIRGMDTAARFGGDEFVVMLSELDIDRGVSFASARIVAEKIRAALSEPYRLNVAQEGVEDTVVEHRCTASIGVVVFQDHEGSQDDMLKWADKAMYEAKGAGRNQIRFFEAGDADQPGQPV